MFFLGIFFTLIGLTVSILFWVTPLVNRSRLKAVLGPRYPLVYFIYGANGPVLLLLGLVLLYRTW